VARLVGTIDLLAVARKRDLMPTITPDTARERS
jgi:hypothetical protein